MKTKREVLPFEVIILAVHGDILAMNKAQKHFEP